MSLSSTWFRPTLPGLAAVCLLGLAPVGTRAETPAPSCDQWLPSQPARGPAWLMNGIGRAHLEITTRSGEAQKFFDQGLELLEAGWPSEADRAFERAAALDPKCAMAQWGIAMVGLDGARRDSAIARAQRLAEAASAHDQLYIEAVASLTAGGAVASPGAFAISSESYRSTLRKIVGSFPGDMTARSLLAQSLVAGYDPDGTPRPGTSEAIALCGVVLKKDPSNAAANHALAHAYESSPWPEKGARAADLFAKAAPAVPHALHVSGQLALRTDHEDAAVRALEAAATLDESYMSKGDETSAHASGPYSHNLFLLATAYADQGRYRDAMRTATRLLDWARLPGEAGSEVALDGRLAVLRLLVRFERWNEILDGRTLPDDGGFVVIKSWRHYALGRAWLSRGDLNRSWSELISLDQGIRHLQPQLPKSAALRPLQDRQMLALQVAPLELKGRILAREGMGDDALRILRPGLELERKHDVSNRRLYLEPMEEAVGDAALELRRWSDATTAYRAALGREPGDGFAMLGLARALEGAGKKAEAAQARAQLAAQWGHADPEVLEASQGVASSAAKGDSTGAPGPAPKTGPRAAVAPEPQAQASGHEPVALAPVAATRTAPGVGPVAVAPPAPATPDRWAGKLRKARVGGTQLAYLDVGKGQPIVLIHGTLSDYRQWAPQIETLSKRYRVIAYSRRYHYPNAPADDHAEYSYAANEADLVGLIRSLHLGRVHLLGHGYGGFVAALVARDHPEMVRTLILVEPSVYSMIPWKKDRRAAVDGLKAAAASSGDAVRAGDPERAAKEFYAVVQGTADAFDSLPEEQRRMMRDNAGTLLLGIESPPAFPCEQVHRIEARTLLIEGDAVTGNKHGVVEGLDRCLPNRNRALIKNASSVANCGNPDAFNEAVIRFLEAPEVPTHLTEGEP